MYLFSGEKLSFQAFVLFCGICASSVISAEEVRPFVIGGAAFGGDDLVETTSSDLSAGGLIYFGGGVLYEPDNSDLMYQFSIGYKFDSIEFSGPSGESSVNVMPLDAVAFYRVDDKMQVGAGLAYYLSPEWELCFDAIGCATETFDDALGFVLEFRGELANENFWGIRYSNVEYESDLFSPIDASNLRIHFGITFDG